MEQAVSDWLSNHRRLDCFGSVDLAQTKNELSARSSGLAIVVADESTSDFYVSVGFTLACTAKHADRTDVQAHSCWRVREGGTMLSRPIDSKTAVLSVMCVAAAVIFAGLPYQEGSISLSAALMGGVLLAVALPLAPLAVGAIRHRILADLRNGWGRFTLDGVLASLQVLAFLSVTDFATRFGFGIPGKCAIVLQVTRYHLIGLVAVAIVQAVVTMRCHRSEQSVQVVPENPPTGEVCVPVVCGGANPVPG